MKAARHAKAHSRIDRRFGRWLSSFATRTIGSAPLLTMAFASLATLAPVRADESLKRRSSWQAYSVQEMAQRLRHDLDQLGVPPATMDGISESFVRAIEAEDADPMDAYLSSLKGEFPAIETLVSTANRQPALAASRIDPSGPDYGAVAGLPDTTQATMRGWLGRELVRRRLFDEALPVLAEVDPSKSIDPAAVLFYRGVCYHTLLMKSDALRDLRKLTENEDDSPVRFIRTAELMIADIKPLKEDSLDEISRIMTDVTRRLDLGRSGQEVADREQQIIDKLTKLIDKIEQQQQQQQQQQSGGSGGAGGQAPSSPMDDSQAAGGPAGNGDVDAKRLSQGPAWGNLPPAERHEAIQQISRDLPTHYREAIEAYFRKLATDE